jgi:hypothetical protein
VTSTPPTPDPSSKPAPDDASTPPAPRKSRFKRIVAWLKRPIGWTTAAVLGTVIGLAVTSGGGWLQNWLSNTHPLKSVVIPSEAGTEGALTGASGTYGPKGFEILVGDARRLPANIGAINDCATLWRVGMSAGGKLIDSSDIPDALIDLHGASNEGMRIISMRAKVSKHTPTPGGLLLACPPEAFIGAGEEPIRVSFDFRTLDLQHSDSVSATRFADGFSISLAKNESIQLDVAISPSIENLDWHIEARVVAGGEIRTITIPPGGKEFHTPGRRQFDDYQEGHSGTDPRWESFVPPLDWGTDKDAVRDRYGQVLRWHGVRIPFTDGLKVYRPFGTGNGYQNEFRQIRYDGRRLISFNPPGVEAEPISLTNGDPCEFDGYSGQATKVSAAVSQIVRHANGEYVHRTIDYTCVGPGRYSVRTRLESVQKVGSKMVFHTDIDERATNEDRELARNILMKIEDNGR